MEATQSFLQATVVGIDVVVAKIRRFRIGFAGSRQHVGRDPGLVREGDNRRAAITAALIGRRDDAVQRRGDRHTVQFRQHRVGRRSVTVTCQDHQYLFG